jgi:hypothetical protein
LITHLPKLITILIVAMTSIKNTYITSVFVAEANDECDDNDIECGTLSPSTTPTTKPSTGITANCFVATMGKVPLGGNQKHKKNDQKSQQLSSLTRNSSNQLSSGTSSDPPTTTLIECSHCDIQRPVTSSHCPYCKACVQKVCPLSCARV